MAKRKIRAFFRQFFGTISDMAFIGLMIALSYIIPADPRSSVVRVPSAGMR